MSSEQRGETFISHAGDKTPARYDEGTLATNHYAATGERGCNPGSTGEYKENTWYPIDLNPESIHFLIGIKTYRDLSILTSIRFTLLVHACIFTHLN